MGHVYTWTQANTQKAPADTVSPLCARLQERPDFSLEEHIYTSERGEYG